MNIRDRKIWLSLMACVFAVIAFTQSLDGIGARRTEDSLVRALATYGIARALNGVISVAQGTEIAIEPVGVGVTLTPGQILDPINDLVERFSWVMLVSSASLGVLNILLAMSVWLWLSIFLVITLAATIYLQWKPAQGNNLLQIVLTRLAMLLIILRFVAPMIAIANDVIYQQFLAPRYQTALTELQDTTREISHINEESDQEPNEDPDQSIVDKARAFYDSASKSVSQTIDVKARMGRYEVAVSKASRHVIDMIVIFIFQTILLPVVFIWVAWHLSRWLVFGHLPVKYIIHQPEN